MSAQIGLEIFDIFTSTNACFRMECNHEHLFHHLCLAKSCCVFICVAINILAHIVEAFFPKPWLAYMKSDLHLKEKKIMHSPLCFRV